MEGPASYIDHALMGGILSGVLLLLAVMWLLFAQNALWRIHLHSVADAELLQLAEGHGFVPIPFGFRAQVGMMGEIRGQRVVLLIKGGARGVRVHLVLNSAEGSRKRIEPFSALDEDLSSWILQQLGEE